MRRFCKTDSVGSLFNVCVFVLCFVENKFEGYNLLLARKGQKTLLVRFVCFGARLCDALQKQVRFASPEATK